MERWVVLVAGLLVCAGLIAWCVVQLRELRQLRREMEEDEQEMAAIRKLLDK